MYRDGGTSHVQDHKTSADEIVTGPKPIADETLKVLQSVYEQLRVAFPSLILPSGSSVRTLFLEITTVSPLGPSPYLSWWCCLTQVMNAIIEIELTALRAIFGISGAIITSVWSISGSILGRPDTPHSVAPTEPSGTSTSVPF
ncbi:hypothetical protein J132_03020 [Termitomyces sp. J132]|nr:hypothetical protein H2248_003681 [Termitomyces sp. 'cryptogamus']KNZ81031.1 hypothetical protein J132_03020 [Termitomyces sp. J132]